MATPMYMPMMPAISMVQQPASVVPICPSARPTGRAPVYLMFLLNKAEGKTDDQQVHVFLVFSLV